MFNRKEKFSNYWWGWNLLWWKIEGIEALNGINVYRLSDPRSAGFILKVGKLVCRVRWSKWTKQMFYRVSYA